ncbi:MAG: electron transfer flavoprotein subunit alpha/FixB family protein [Candidatus Methanofastidiosia archaeon]
MKGNIFVMAEHQRGKISEITFEMLGIGREIADELGYTLTAILLGHKAKEMSAFLGLADSVLYVEHEALFEMTPESCLKTLLPILKERNPEVLLVGCTNLSMGVGSLLSSELNLPFVNFCKNLRVENKKIVATCVLYGGKIEAEVQPKKNQAIVGISSGVFRAERGKSTKTPPVEEISPTIETLEIQFKRYIEPEPGDVDITKQDILVAVGRGIQNKENLPIAEELLTTLSGALCASRPIVDQGWLPMTRQVGKSGMIVRPKLYLAAGISGAPEHVEGMKGSKLVISINTDPNAPIFDVSHYGVVGDALEILPILTEVIRKKRGG